MENITKIINEIKNTISPRSILDSFGVSIDETEMDKIMYKSKNAKFEILTSIGSKTLFIWHFMSTENEKFIIECNNNKYFIYVEDNKYKKYYNYNLK